MNNITLETSELNTLCIHCLHPQMRGGWCSQCGYNEHKYQAHPLYLQPRTLLKNQYIIGLPLGQGGFGVTYLGLDRWLQKKVAIKEYLPVALATRNIINSNIVPLKQQEDSFYQGIQFFIKEARNLAKFNHPNIVQVINFFEQNQTGYMVMEYLEGTPLANLLNQGNSPLSVNEALKIILPILDALAQVHAQHIYHRDISLQNILILTTGEPILIDFGAARYIVGEYTRSLDLVLKHGYSPLEQYSGKGRIGPWTDIYACGALLYLLITGQLPPAATDRFGGEQLIAPAQLGIALPPMLNEAIMQALAIKIEDRFPTVQAFKATLQGQPSPAQTTTMPLVQKPLVNHPKSHFSLKITLVSLVVVSVLLTIAYLFDSDHQENRQLNSLLEQAQLQWSNHKITQPVGDNAYETYQQVLAIAPNNTQARTEILKIANYYQQLANDYQQAGRLKASLAQIEQGLQVMPTHLELQALEQTLKKQLEQQQQEQTRAKQVKQLLTQANRQLTLLQLENAYQTYQAVLALDPHNQRAQQGVKKIADKYVQLVRTETETTKKLLFIQEGLSKFPQHNQLRALQQQLSHAKTIQQQQIEKLLNQANQQLAVLRLTTPKGDNAYETYQQILKLAPAHPEAKAGLIKIANQYEQLAQIEQNDLHKNLALINKGLKIVPNHAGLLALNQKIMEQMQHETAHFPNKPVVSQKKSRSPTIESPSLSNQTKVKVEAPLVSVLPQLPSSTSTQAPAKTPMKTPLTNNTVAELITIAKQHVKIKQFEAAYQTYQNILTIAPHNKQAIIGLQQLAHHYEQLAQTKNQQGELEESLLLINKGLLAYPSHSGLLALQKEVNQRLNNQNATTTPSSQLIFTPSF